VSDPANLEIGRPADEAELRAYRRLASQAFSAQPSNQQDVSRLIEQGGSTRSASRGRTAF
jgi:hypothetical protein